MKKIIALFISALTLFLCACSGQADKPAETTETTTPESTVKYSADWRTAPLPANFPAPPEKMYDFYFSTGKGSETGSGYRSDWLRLYFTCPENEFYLFAGKFAESGYIGSFKNFSDTTEYYPAGYYGNWQDGEHLVRINKAVAQDNGDIKFTLDIVECSDNFPEALTQFFPKFDGFTKSAGSYCGHDESNESETTEFNGAFESPYWHWNFVVDNCFVGVEKSEVEEYVHKLGLAGFVGPYVYSQVDKCDVISIDLTKDIGGSSYGVFMLYNQTLKTFDILYTNNSESYLSSEE